MRLTWHKSDDEIYSECDGVTYRHVAADERGAYVEQSSPVAITHLPDDALQISRELAAELIAKARGISALLLCCLAATANAATFSIHAPMFPDGSMWGFRHEGPGGKYYKQPMADGVVSWDVPFLNGNAALQAPRYNNLLSPEPFGVPIGRLGAGNSSWVDLEFTDIDHKQDYNVQRWYVTYSGDGINTVDSWWTIAWEIPGNFDPKHRGSVSGKDFLLWQRNVRLGADPRNGTSLDGEASARLRDWEINYGWQWPYDTDWSDLPTDLLLMGGVVNVPPPRVGAVPEPGSLGMCCMAAAAALWMFLKGRPFGRCK